MAKNRSEAARELAQAHGNLEDSVALVVQLLAPGEGLESHEEPIKLLEVNEATLASGIVPVRFGPAPPEHPFESIVVEVTRDEYEAIQRRDLHLPNDWSLGSLLFERPGPAAHA